MIIFYSGCEQIRPRIVERVLAKASIMTAFAGNPVAIKRLRKIDKYRRKKNGR